jgi:hypothetical protein
VEATTCTTYRNGKTYRTTYRTCLSARKLRYGKTQPTCAVQVEEVEIDNEMPNPTGKRPTLDRIPDKADQAEWQRLKAALKLSNKHLIEASGVRSMALYDWFADRLVTRETENRIKDGLRKLQDQEAGRTHVPADEAANWEMTFCDRRPNRSPNTETTSIPAMVTAEAASFGQELAPAVESVARSLARAKDLADLYRVESADIWDEARQFAEAASKMARLNLPLFRLICDQAVEQVAK